MRKLVRDKIPEIIRADGKEPILETCSEEEFIPMLLEKLKEEVAELEKVAGSDKDSSIDELSDIYEVLIQICLQIGSSPLQVQQHMSTKQKERGGFYNRVIWKGNREDLVELTAEEQEILIDAYFNVYHESQFQNQPTADRLYETLLERKPIWLTK